MLFVGQLTFSQSKMMKEDTKMVGGAAMYPSKNIVENAVNSKDHTTLVAAVKAAGLVDVLMSEGPFTVFAPTNDAFNKLPSGTVNSYTVSSSTQSAWWEDRPCGTYLKEYREAS